MAKQKLFDGDEAQCLKQVFEIENFKVKLIDFYNNPLRELREQIGDVGFETIIKENKFNISNGFTERYASKEGLEIYYLKKNEMICLFSYGEFQPSRYFLFLEGICRYISS